MKAARLVISILSLVFVPLIGLHSCSVIAGNALLRPEDVGGGGGVFIGLFMLTAGIVGIVTRNSKSKGGSITVACCYVLSGLIGVVSAGSSSISTKGLAIWSVPAFIFAAVFILSIIFDKNLQKGERSET